MIILPVKPSLLSPGEGAGGPGSFAGGSVDAVHLGPLQRRRDRVGVAAAAARVPVARCRARSDNLGIRGSSQWNFGNIA